MRKKLLVKTKTVEKFTCHQFLSVAQSVWNHDPSGFPSIAIKGFELLYLVDMVAVLKPTLSVSDAFIDLAKANEPTREWNRYIAQFRRSYIDILILMYLMWFSTEKQWLINICRSIIIRMIKNCTVINVESPRVGNVNVRFGYFCNRFEIWRRRHLLAHKVELTKIYQMFHKSWNWAFD